MRILIVGQFFYPDNFRINDIVKNFVEMGNEVTVVTGLPDYETGYIPKDFKFFKRRRENFHGAEIIRVPIIQRRSGAFFRSLNYISFVVSGSIHLLLKREKFDRVFVFQTSPVTMAIPGIIYGKLNKVEIILYCLDIWPECVKAMNIQEGTPFFDLIHSISKKTYNAVDKILVSSKSFLEYLNEFNNVPMDKIQYLPQYTDEDLFQEKTADVESATHPVNFLFAGNIGLVQDVETIIRAVNVIPPDLDFRVDIVGSGSNLNYVSQLVTEYGLGDKILFHGRKSMPEMNAYYDKADVCLLTLKNTGKIGMTVPGKLQTYMAKGKAIAAAIDGDSVEVITNSESGYAVESGNYKGLSEIMIRYLDNPELIQHHGQNAYIYYKNNFDKQIFFNELLKFMEV